MIFAEPDYTRPMALGLNIGFKNNGKKFEMVEGIIKDRYDDSDPMIDYSEQVSKNKLLSNGKTFKFIISQLPTTIIFYPFKVQFKLEAP